MLNANNIRNDFPVLQMKINGKPIIYMDSACVTLKPIQVINAVNRYYQEFPACAGRSMHSLGKRVEEEVSKARKTIQKFLDAKNADEIIFMKNTTEGVNVVANSLYLKKDDVVLMSDKEHSSMLLPFLRLTKKGVKREIFKFGDLKDFQDKLNKDVKLVAFVHTSNLDGTTNPIKEIIKMAHDNGSLVLVDGAQSVPHIEISVKKLDVDFLAFSGHKALGPSGTGILYGKEHLLNDLEPLIIGGHTVKNTTYASYELDKPPERFEAGLQNYAGIIGLGEAVRYLSRFIKDLKDHEHDLNKLITDEFSRLGINILGPEDPKLRSGIISFNIKKIDPHEVAGLLNESANIMVRSGMHCVHSWFNAHKINGSVRASLYIYNTKEECRVLIEEIKKVCKMA